MTVLTASTTATGRQRRLLQVDAALSGALGTVLAVAAPSVADLLGTTAETALRWLGVALGVLAAGLLLLARSRSTRPGVLAAGAGSLAWEVASLAVAVLVDLSATGTALVVAQGLAFGALGVLQLRAGRA